MCIRDRFVRREDLPAEGRPRGLTWLAGVLSAGERHLCADPEFVTRRGGLDALAAAYAMDVERLTDAVIPATEEHAISGVARRRCFAGLATATSGEAVAAGLVPVTDDLSIFPAFVVAPVARTAHLQAAPQVRSALERVTTALDTPGLAQMNAEVERGRDPAQVAEDFFGGTG